MAHPVSVVQDIPFEILVEVLKWVSIGELFRSIRFVSKRWRDAACEMLRDEARMPYGRVLHVRRSKLLTKPDDVPWHEYLVVVESLSIPYALSTPRLKSLSGLEECRSLAHLDLYGSRISDLDMHYLTGLTSLRTLNISYTQIEDIHSLATCTSLTSLYASRTKIKDVSALSSLRQLQTIDISDTSVVDVSALVNCPSLRIVNVRSTKAACNLPSFRKTVIVGVA